MTAITTSRRDSRTVDMYTATKSNQKEVFSLKQGETFVKAKTEGDTYQSEKLRPPSRTLRALILISHCRCDWQEFHK